jgi:hypothetical protein
MKESIQMAGVIKKSKSKKSKHEKFHVAEIHLDINDGSNPAVKAIIVQIYTSNNQINFENLIAWNDEKHYALSFAKDCNRLIENVEKGDINLPAGTFVLATVPLRKLRDDSEGDFRTFYRRVGSKQQNRIPISKCRTENVWALFVESQALNLKYA